MHTSPASQSRREYRHLRAARDRSRARTTASHRARRRSPQAPLIRSNTWYSRPAKSARNFLGSIHLAPANRRRPCHEGVGGQHPQREHGRQAPAGELPLAVGGSAQQRILSSFPLNAARRWASSATMLEEDGPARRHDDRRGIDADVHGEDRAPLAVASCAAPRSSATTGRGARSKLHSHSPW